MGTICHQQDTTRTDIGLTDERYGQSILETVDKGAEDLGEDTEHLDNPKAEPCYRGAG